MGTGFSLTTKKPFPSTAISVFDAVPSKRPCFIGSLSVLALTPPAVADVERLCVTRAWNCVVESLKPTVLTLAMLSDITAKAVD